MFLSLETLKSIIRTGSPILVELIDLVICYISNDLTQMVNFPTFIVLLFWISFFLDASICSTMAFPPLGNSGHLVVSVSIDFPSNLQWDSPFHCIAYDYSCAH